MPGNHRLIIVDELLLALLIMVSLAFLLSTLRFILNYFDMKKSEEERRPFEEYHAKMDSRTWPQVSAALAIFAVTQLVILILVISYPTEPEIITYTHPILIKAAAICFISALTATHLVLFLRRNGTSVTSIKCIDYVYFSFVLLAIYVNFSNLFEAEALVFKRVLALDLALTGVALRIAKTTAEVLRWHR